MTIKKWLVTCAAAAATFGTAFVAEATTQAYWTGKGADNKWGTAANWRGNVVPGLADEDWRVYFQGVTCTVEIEAGQTYTVDDWFRVSDGSHVTLVGSGTVKNTNWTYVDDGTELTIDGPTVTVNKGDNSGKTILVGNINVKSGSFQKSSPIVGGNTRIVVEGGVFGSTGTTSGNYLTVTNDAEVIVTGGEFKMGFLKLMSNGDGTGGTMRMLGGVSSFYNVNTYLHVIGEGAMFDFKGGTIRWPTGNSLGRTMNFTGASSAMRNQHKCFLPPKGATLDIPTSYASGAALGFSMNGDFSVGGTVYVTNATDVAAGNVYLGATDVSVSGGGTIYANRLAFNPSDSAEAKLDLSSINLGSGGIVSATTKYAQTVQIPNGITFGAWADWSMNEPNGRKLVVKGPLAFDTADALDATKDSHAISVTGLDVADVTEINVKGGGSVTLDSRNCPEQLRRVAVADGGTLALEGAFGFVKTMDFALGTGSTLKLDISEGGSVDVAATAAIGEGAKVVVTKVPTTLKTGKQYPIFNLPPRKGDPTSRPVVELPDGVPDGWDVRWIANCCYLGEETTVAGTYTTEKAWTGKGADNLYSNTDNWLNGKVGTGTSVVYFHGTSNTVIDVDIEHTCRYFRFLSACGAYVLRGDNELKFRYPYGDNMSTTASVLLESAWPVVIENDINNYYQTVSSQRVYADHFRFWSNDEGSISVLGDSKKELPLGFRGDVRLGGNWTATDLQPSSASNGRRTGLTVLPSATLSVTGQAKPQNITEYFAVAAGGMMTVAGEAFTFTNKPSTHFVDGALTVNCPFETATLQTFRGSGMLKLLGGVSAPDEATTGGIRLEGENLTFVPGGTWSETVPLTVRGSVTIAPVAAWTLAAPLNLDDHSTLTVSGANVRLDAPLVSAGEVVVDGGRLVLGAAGTKLWKVSCVNGGCVEIADDVLVAGRFADILSVRRDDSTLVFPDGLKIKKRYDLASDSYIYSAKPIRSGLYLLFR